MEAEGSSFIGPYDKGWSAEEPPNWIRLPASGNWDLVRQLSNQNGDNQWTALQKVEAY